MPWEQLLGPLGALAAALVAVGALWKNHLDSDAQRSRDKDAALEYERVARKEAETRLDAFRELGKVQADVTERAVAAAERAVARSGRSGAAGKVDTGSG